MKKLNNKGFTLIELLVVIAIIGLLASMVLVAVSTARAKAKDARVKADVQQIRVLAEASASDSGSYSDTTSWPTAAQTSYGTLSGDIGSQGGTVTKNVNGTTSFCISSTLPSDSTKSFCLATTGKTGTVACGTGDCP
ncbi:MAG: type II secretion system protein [bacterium]|nr:type II secretion system protein [bacterium]